MERKVNINNIKKTLDIIYGTSQKVYELKANANDMNTEVSRQNFFWIQKNNKELKIQ